MLYFGDPLPAPLRAKILYKLMPHATLMVKPPERSYGAAFADAYGWWAAVALAAAIAHGLRRGGFARALSAAAVPLIIYVAVVGDWMFGFRFFVALLPVFSVIVATAVSSVAHAAPRAAVALSLAWIVGMGVAAARFTESYSSTLALPSFLHAPSRDLHLFFRPYYGFYETIRPVVPVGSITAYNQAGLLPYLLDLNNIDDLGLCSRFYASLPSTDVYFTEGGRYVALTNKPRLRVHEAYLLYRNAQFILSGTDVLRRANGTAIPSRLLGDRYQLATTDARHDFAVYRRIEQPPEEITAAPRTFVENVAHVSYLRRAAIDGAPVDSRDYAWRFPFLRDGTANFQFTGSFSFDVQFARADERVYAVSIDEVRATRQASLAITLLGTGGRIVDKIAVPLEAGAFPTGGRGTSGGHDRQPRRRGTLDRPWRRGGWSNQRLASGGADAGARDVHRPRVAGPGGDDVRRDKRNASLALTSAVAPLQHFSRNRRGAAGDEVEPLCRGSGQIDHAMAARFG